MDYIFLDTNALLKLYLSEVGSTWLKGYVVGKRICVSELAVFESATTLARRFLAGEFTRNQAYILLTLITQDCDNTYELVPLNNKLQANRVFGVAEQWPITSRIRTLDTIQLAAASTMLEIANLQQPSALFTLVSSDVQLLRVAQLQGFTIENPESYP